MFRTKRWRGAPLEMRWPPRGRTGAAPFLVAMWRWLPAKRTGEFASFRKGAARVIPLFLPVDNVDTGGRGKIVRQCWRAVSP
jgi:hypothetical protein